MYTKNVADQPGTGRHSVTKWGGYEASKEAPFFGNSPRRRAEPPGAKSVLCDLGPRSPKAPVIRDCSSHAHHHTGKIKPLAQEFRTCLETRLLAWDLLGPNHNLP